MADMLTVEVDVKPVVEWLESAAPKQVAFGVSYGLNKLALEIQSAIQASIERRFNLRRKTWVLHRIYISKADRATKDNWVVIIKVDEPRDILNKFEDGGTHFPYNGHNHLVIPNKTIFKDIIRSSDPLSIRNLQLKETKPNHLQGNYGTFLIDSKTTGTPLVLQDMSAIAYKNAGNLRTLKKLERGLNKKDPRIGNRILYTLVKSSKVPAKLEFITTANHIVDTRLADVMTDAVDHAIRTAR
jgi:hypothetical protein